MSLIAIHIIYYLPSKMGMGPGVMMGSFRGFPQDGIGMDVGGVVARFSPPNKRHC